MKSIRNKRLYMLSILVLFGTFSTMHFFLKNRSQKGEKVIKSLSKEEAYFIPLKILGYSSTDMPYLEMIVENETITTKIDLGYDGMLSLPSDIIKKIHTKEFIKRIQTYGMRGKIYENDVYKVNRIKIKNFSFFPVKVKEQNLEFINDALLAGDRNPSDYKFGTIGWHLFYNFNLLVDCEHSIFALCDSLETLKQHDYPVNSFIETPLLLDRGFIEFEAITEAGPLRCMLDTGATWNLLNKDLENGCNEHMIFTGKEIDPSVLNPENKDLLIFDPEDTQEIVSFKIGGKEFGPLTFDRIKSPIAVDAVIGMEFIDYALIFIDFSNRKIYFFEYPPEEKASSTEFLVKEDHLLFLRLLLPHSCLPACVSPSPPTTRSFLLNVRPRLMQNVSPVKIMKNDPPRDH